MDHFRGKPFHANSCTGTEKSKYATTINLEKKTRQKHKKANSKENKTNECESNKYAWMSHR